MKTVLQVLTGLPSAQVDADFPDSQLPYDILIEAPQVPQAQIREYALSEILRELEIQRTTAPRDAEVIVIERLEDAPAPPRSKAEKASYSQRGPQLTAKDQPMARLADFVSVLTGGKPVLDETGLEGGYDYAFEIYSKEDLVRQLAELGLRYRKTERAIPFVTYRRTKAPAPGGGGAR